MVRIVVADDHPMYLEAACLTLHRAFPDAVTYPVSSVDEVLEVKTRLDDPVDLVLLDLSMAGMDNGNAISIVRNTFPGARVVLMSGIATLSDVRKAFTLGASGFLSKTMQPDHFARALGLILQGGTYIPADLLETDLPQAPALHPASTIGRELEGLTERELAVLQMLPEGLMNKEIARVLGLAEMTVKLHVRQILRKLNARNRAEAAAIAQRAGIRNRAP